MREPASAFKKLINRLPDPDERGLLSKIDKDTVDEVIATLHEGGRESLTALVDMLVEPGKGDDVKPRYALHCLAVYVCKLSDRQRRAFGKALASQLERNHPKAVQKYLIEQLQVAGGEEAVPALGRMLLDEDLCESAAQALVAIGHNAAEPLRRALTKIAGKSRLTIVQNLGVVRDKRSTGALKEALGSNDREIRLAAGWALANIGDDSSVDLLLKAADESIGYERIKATKACLLLAERLLDTDQKDLAVRIYHRLRDTRKGTDDSYVCDAANKGLAAAGYK
jgi:HEAT repeat protein